MAILKTKNPTRKVHFNNKERLWLISVGVMFTGLCIYPIWASSYGLSVIRDALIFGTFALSLDFMYGKAGMLSWGHAGFFGIGAYCMAIVTLNLNDPNASALGLFAAIALAGSLALVVGSFLIYAGVRRAYFVIMTIAFTLVISQLAISWSSVTGGDAGLVGVSPLGFKLFGVHYCFESDLSTYFLALGLSTAALLALWFVCRGNYGKILFAIANNETRAQTFGHNTNRHLLIVFVISAMLAALSGAILAAVIGFVAPDLADIILSTEVIMWVMVGGRGTLLGPFIGTLVVMRMQQEISSISTTLWPFILGVFFVVTVFLFPNGLIPVGRLLFSWLARSFRTLKRE